jgi:anti-sigma-K factor RskA
MFQPTEIHTLAGAYALDALTEGERAAFARHIVECPSCAAEVAELTETASRLSVAAGEAPPPRLRDAVLAEVARTRQVTSGRAEPTGPSVPNEVRTWRRRAALALAAGIVALSGLGTVWVVQDHRVSDARLEAQQAQSAQARLSAIVAAGDAEVHSTRVGDGTITVALSHKLDDGVVLMENMPAPPAGKVYQLWLIAGAKPSSVGVMAAGQRTGSALVDSVGPADTIGLTLEPTGGSSSPTLPVVAGVAIT